MDMAKHPFLNSRLIVPVSVIGTCFFSQVHNSFGSVFGSFALICMIFSWLIGAAKACCNCLLWCLPSLKQIKHVRLWMIWGSCEFFVTALFAQFVHFANPSALFDFAFCFYHVVFFCSDGIFLPRRLVCLLTLRMPWQTQTELVSVLHTLGYY